MTIPQAATHTHPMVRHPMAMVPIPGQERWTYEGAGGLVFPTRVGQLWEVGQHIYQVADFMNAGHPIVQELIRRYPPTLLYCDPPWGQGLINQFRTKAGLTKAEYRWEDLYRRILGYVPAPPSPFPIWLESGKREKNTILTQILRDYPNVRAFDTTYYRRNPSLVYYAGPTPPPVDVTGMDDADTPEEVLKHYPKGRVFDPCAGLGGTARAAAAQGWSSLSIEMSPFRASAGLYGLREVTGIEPVLLHQVAGQHVQVNAAAG